MPLCLGYPRRKSLFVKPVDQHECGAGLKDDRGDARLADGVTEASETQTSDGSMEFVPRNRLPIGDLVTQQAFVVRIEGAQIERPALTIRSTVRQPHGRFGKAEMP